MIHNTDEIVECIDNEQAQLSIEIFQNLNTDCKDSNWQTSYCKDSNYSSQVLARIQTLVKWGECPLPVAPRNEFLKDRYGELLYNGRNPSNKDSRGIAHIISASDYYSRYPTSEEFTAWFENLLNGICCLISGDSSMVCIDWDAKNFASQDVLDRLYQEFLDRNPCLKEAYQERTPSGGYHIYIWLPKGQRKPFYKFKFGNGSEDFHGELLGCHNIVVMAPTPGYIALNDHDPVSVESIESLGILPTYQPKLPALPEIEFDERDFLDSKVSLLDTSEIAFESLLSRVCQSYLKGKVPPKKQTSNSIDNFGAFQALRNEIYGWENWLTVNKKTVSGTADELIQKGLEALIKPDQRSIALEKCKKSREKCTPGIFSYGENENCVRQIQRCLGHQVERLTPSDFAHSKQHQARAKRKVFTPDLTFNAAFLNDVVTPQVLRGYMESLDIIAIKSAMGTGKTEILVPLRKDSKTGGVTLGSRNSLLLQTVARLSDTGKPVYHLSEDEGRGLIPDSSSWLALCIDSLHHFQPSDFDDKILIIDEATSVYVHTLLSSTVGKNKGGRALHLNLFAQFVQRARNIILLDGNLNDDVVRWIAEKRAEGDRSCNVLKLENFYQPAPVNISMISVFDAKGKEKPFDQAPLIHHMEVILNAYRGLVEGRRAIVVVSDSQMKLEALDRHFTVLGFKVLRIDSKTIQEPEIKLILADLNNVILREQYDAVLLSPTAESGVDISVKDYFVAQFGLFTGLLPTDSQMQFLRRVRDCPDWFVACVPYTNLQPYTKLDDLVSIVELAMGKALNHADQQEILEKALTSIHLSRHSKDFAHAKALVETLIHERRNSRECLVEALESAGHNLTEVKIEEEEATRKHTQEIVEGIKQEKACKTFNAAAVSIDDARKMSKSMQQSTEEKAAIDRAFLLDRLQGIEDSEEWTTDFVRGFQDDRGKGVKSLERFYSLNHMAESKLLAQKALMGTMTEHESTAPAVYQAQRTELGLQTVKSFRDFTPWDIKNDYALIESVYRLGFLTLLDGRKYTQNSPEIVEICKQIRECPDTQKVLRVSGITGNLQMIQMIFDNFGVTSTRSQEQTKGTREYHYRFISPLEVKDEKTRKLNEVLLECIDRKFKSRLIDKHGEAVEAPIDEQYDEDAFVIEGIPHPRLILGEEEYKVTLEAWIATRNLGARDRLEKRRTIVAYVKQRHQEKFALASVDPNEDF